MKKVPEESAGGTSRITSKALCAAELPQIKKQRNNKEVAVTAILRGFFVVPKKYPMPIFSIFQKIVKILKKFQF